MRTTAKPVIDKVREHILEAFNELAEYDKRENGNIDATPLSELVAQIDYMRRPNRTIYQTALDWVEGGGLLIYFGDVGEFLDSLGINDSGREYSDEKSWKLYCHLVAREMTKLYEKNK